MRRRRFIVAALAIVALAGCGDDADARDNQAAKASDTSSTRPAPEVAELLVGGASDLRPAFEELGRMYEKSTGTKVRFTFGSSGQLKEQIKQGGPYDLYASANVAFIDEIIEAGKGDPATKETYAFGRIVVWSDGKHTPPPKTLNDLTAPAIAKLAIANPAHAPYGLAAQQALESSGLYNAVKGKLVLGENISDTLRLATTGNADAAIVALSLVITKPDGVWKLVPADAHKPLEQALIVTAEDPARAKAAKAFIDLEKSEDGRAVMTRYGFVLPGEDPV